MRALILTLVIAAAAIGGFLYYRQSTDSGAGGSMFAPPPPAPPLATAEDCPAEHAVYEFNDDRRIVMRFRRLASTGGQDYEVAEFQGRRMGNLEFVVQVTSFQSEYVFRPVNSGPSEGPMYVLGVTYLRPAAGGAQFPVSLFDSDMHYIGQLPRNDSEAPGYIFMPGMLPILYRDRVNQPPGVFRFQSCDMPAPAAEAPAAP